jgi:hypothetical protein
MAELRVFTRRWGHDDVYTVVRTGTGWTVNHVAIGGDCDRTGAPFLYANFEQDSVKYPHDIGVALERLWEHAGEQNLTDAQIQPHLNQLGEWISICERATPEGDVFGF